MMFRLPEGSEFLRAPRPDGWGVPQSLRNASEGFAWRCCHNDKPRKRRGAGGAMSEEKLLIVWDVVEIAQAWLETVYPDLDEEDKALYGDDPESAIFADEGFWYLEWDTTMDQLRYEMEKRGLLEEPLIVHGHGLGWRKRSGHKEIRGVKDGASLLREILPATDVTFAVYEGDVENSLKIVASHHDAMGEVYEVESVDAYVRSLDLDKAVRAWIENALEAFEDASEWTHLNMDRALERCLEDEDVEDLIDTDGGEYVWDAIRERMWAMYEAHYQHVANLTRWSAVLHKATDVLTCRVAEPEAARGRIQDLFGVLDLMVCEVHEWLEDNPKPPADPVAVDELIDLIGERG